MPCRPLNSTRAGIGPSWPFSWIETWSVPAFGMSSSSSASASSSSGTHLLGAWPSAVKRRPMQPAGTRTSLRSASYEKRVTRCSKRGSAGAPPSVLTGRAASGRSGSHFAISTAVPGGSVGSGTTRVDAAPQRGKSSAASPSDLRDHESAVDRRGELARAAIHPGRSERYGASWKPFDSSAEMRAIVLPSVDSAANDMPRLSRATTAVEPAAVDCAKPVPSIHVGTLPQPISSPSVSDSSGSSPAVTIDSTKSTPARSE